MARVWQTVDTEPSTWDVTLPFAASLDRDFYVGGAVDGFPFDSITFAFSDIDVTGVDRCSGFLWDDMQRTVSPGWGTNNSDASWTTFSTPAGTTDPISVVLGQGILKITYKTSIRQASVKSTPGGPWTRPDWTMTIPVMFENFDPTVESEYIVGIAGPALSLSFIVSVGGAATTGQLGYGGSGLTPQEVTLGSPILVGTTYYLQVQMTGFVGSTKSWRMRLVADPAAAGGNWQLSASGGTLDQSPDNYLFVTLLAGGGAGSGDLDTRTNYIDFAYPGKPCYDDCSATEAFVIDDFNRIVATGWGVASSGGTWVKDAFSGSTTEFVDGSTGHLVTVPSAFSFTRMSLSLPDATTWFSDRDYVEFRWLVISRGQQGDVAVWDGGSTYIWWDLTDGGDIGWGRGQGGSIIPPQLATGNPDYADETPFWVAMRLQADGKLYIRHWLASASEPTTWIAPVEPDFTSALQIDEISSIYMNNGNSGTLALDKETQFNHIFTTVPTCTPVIPTSIQTDPSGFGCEAPQRINSTTFQCSASMVAGSSRVYVNGLRQRPALDYTESTAASGTIVFADPVATGAEVSVCYTTAGPLGGGA
jgi:hypothetical protein